MRVRWLMRYLGLAGLLFLLGFVLFCSYERQQYNLVSNAELRVIRENLKALDEREIRDLRYFLDYATTFCQYPYTLVGYKPMSICNYLQESDDLPPVLKADYERPKHRQFADSLERGYRAFERYLTLFPQDNYLLLQYHASNSAGMKETALILPSFCLNQIQKHLDDFHQMLKGEYSKEEIFQILTQPSHEQFYHITQNCRLLGILLGFGRNNACLFEQRKLDRLKCFTNEWPVWPRRWRLPGFVCDPSTEETRLLKNRYTTARKYIRWTYFNRDNTEVTLALLAKKCPIQDSTNLGYFNAQK